MNVEKGNTPCSLFAFAEIILLSGLRTFSKRKMDAWWSHFGVSFRKMTSKVSTLILIAISKCFPKESSKIHASKYTPSNKHII